MVLKITLKRLEVVEEDRVLINLHNNLSENMVPILIGYCQVGNITLMSVSFINDIVARIFNDPILIDKF